jgi:membrane protein DedA with SNARE-associated domain
MVNSHVQFVTYPTILVAVFASQMCLPVPAMFFLIMGGALGASGRLNIFEIILTSIAACLVADFAWFQAGRWWGSRILRILCGFSSDRRYCTQRSQAVFARWGLGTLTVAKFIPGLDSLMPPLAGLEGATTMEFLCFDAVGAVLWSSVYCLLGYFFADRVTVVAAALTRVGSMLVMVIGIPFLC